MKMLTMLGPNSNDIQRTVTCESCSMIKLPCLLKNWIPILCKLFDFIHNHPQMITLKGEGENKVRDNDRAPYLTCDNYLCESMIDRLS